IDDNINQEAISDNNTFMDNNLPANPPGSNDAVNPNPPNSNNSPLQASSIF
ncbi:hypothetical protein HN51_045001, partial [Arachis hypogaea]